MSLSRLPPELVKLCILVVGLAVGGDYAIESHKVRAIVFTKIAHEIPVQLQAADTSSDTLMSSPTG